MTDAPIDTLQEGPIRALLRDTFRDEAGRIRAQLISLCGDFEAADAALSLACERALFTWPKTPPDNPGAWLTTTARRIALDARKKARTHLRHEDNARDALYDDGPDNAVETNADFGHDPLSHGVHKSDDRLRLLFTCCHPAIDAKVRVPLTLHALCGLSTEEVARAFLVEPTAMAQRLVRAKRKIKAAAIPYRVPARAELTERLKSVLDAIYLVFNEGYSATRGDSLLRRDLCANAIALARLVRDLLPDEMEAQGLLALMLLHDARKEARTDAEGHLVLLEEQDRTLWDHAQIGVGQQLAEAAFVTRRIGPFCVQAAIAALHGAALRPEQTDWAQIAGLYAVLARMTPSPVVEINRAVAVAMSQGADAGLAILDALDSDGALCRYHLFAAARADLAARAGRIDEARSAYDTAIDLVKNDRERALLTKKRAALGVAG